MGKRRMFDEDVQEVFSAVGGESIALFFEAIRYRHQLYDKDEFVPFKSSDMQNATGLSYKRQARARKVLEATGWLEVKHGHGNIVQYKITDLAKQFTKSTPRPHGSDWRKKLSRTLHKSTTNSPLFGR